MTGRQPVRRYVHGAYVEDVLARLSNRDLMIIESLGGCRVLSGSQIERLHFTTLSPNTRSRTRRLVLARLTEWGAIAPLTRTIGGINGGSSGLLFSLDAAGQRIIQILHDASGESPTRVRRPWTPGQLFLQHSLAVAELYVSLVESGRTQGFSVTVFMAEPSSWWPNGLGGWLKPDAYAVLEGTRGRLHFWAEVDRATESLVAVRQQFTAYLDFWNRGQLGPSEVMPLVAVSVPTERRRDALRDIVTRLPDPAAQLFTVVLAPETAALLGSLVSREPP